MDGVNFDRLARVLAVGASRRASLGALLAALTATADAAAQRNRPRPRPRGCFGRSCRGGGGCCEGFDCCDGFCTKVRQDPGNCGACGVVCGDSETCRRGSCRCMVRPCGDACCGFDETCLDAAASTCGACPVGAGIEDPAAVVGCGPGRGAFSLCACVTSVDDVAACSFTAGFCVDCESDDQCSLAMGRQALCIPVGDECARFKAARACVEASCDYFGEDEPIPARAAIAGAGPYMRFGPARRR